MIEESKRPLTREERQAAVIKALPARVRASEVYARMEAALKDTVYRFKRQGKHLTRLYKALEAFRRVVLVGAEELSR